uniref:C2H2-type domain-containing protein n=1 Tax=Ditylenchus dipsaci TaxID=166011 RepID=A0A915CN17_9BILA
MRCNECNKGFKFPSTATILKRHWSKQHSEKEQPADRIGSHTSPPHTKKSKIEQALVHVVSIPALAINMLLHPLVRNLFQVLNPHVEMPESFGTMKEMLRVQFNSVRKSIKEEIAKLQTRPSITCDVSSDSSMKHAYLVHVDTMFLDEPSEEEEDEENEEDEIYSMETEILLQTVFPLRIRCFAHSLQLVILRFFKELVEPISGFCTLRALVGKFKHSVSATQDLLTSTGKILVKASSTRWASFILVIERYLEVYEVVRSIAQAKKWSCPTAVETEFLRGVYNMMKIMVDVLERIQGEKVVTISHAYGFVKAMKRGVAKFKENLETRNLAEALLKLIDDRFCVMYDALHLSFDPIYLMAAAFDSNTAHLLEEIEFELAVSSIQGLIKRSEEAENVDYVPLNKERSELDVMLGEIVAEQRAKRQQKRDCMREQRRGSVMFSSVEEHQCLSRRLQSIR